MLIANLNENISDIKRQLESPQNYRKFFWTPDFNSYGFASTNQIQRKMDHWQKIEELRRKKKVFAFSPTEIAIEDVRYNYDEFPAANDFNAND
jgi:hypothetical protein